MKKRLPLAALSLIAVLLVWAARPLRSSKWDIEFDPNLQAGKDSYLDGIGRLSAKSDRPNVLIILADDLGMTDISLYGSPHLETPNIDSIGREGITYSQAYATAPICSPSRAGLLTGRYQNRYGFDSQPMTRYARSRLEYWCYRLFVNTYPMFPIDNESIPSESQIERQGMPPTEILLSEALSASGYRCGAVGKWHLGYGDLQAPTNRGFDSFYGFLEAFTAYADPKRPDIESVQFGEFSEKHIWRQKRKGPSAIRRNGEVIEEEDHLTDAIAREAAAKIRDYASEDEPFFLYVPFSAPHTPFQALTSYTEKFSDVEDPAKRIYYALISQLDDAVGEILDELEASGQAENTLVIFASDNGGATYTGATGNDPLRGGKMSHFEGGLSVPLVLRWPASLSSGVQEDAPVLLTDVFTTVLNAAGVPLPEDRPIDGIDLFGRGGKAGDVAWGGQFISSDSADYTAADSSQAADTASAANTAAAVDIAGPPEDRPLFWRADYNHVTLWNGWKLIENGKDGRIWLYNIENDREENNNLAEERPDMVNMLHEAFEAWNAEMMRPSWPRVMDYFYNEDGEGYWFAT